MTKLSVEVWSDVACPWCWVGKRHLEDAIAGFAHPVHLVWRAFELDPGASKRPERVEDYVGALARKYRTSRDGAQQMIDQMTTRGAQAGVEFRFDRVRRTNTFDAHRLLHLGAEHDRQDELKERLLLAYFNEGRDVADGDTLVELATDVGIDAEYARVVVRSDRYDREVRTEEAVAMRLGVTGVPFFVFAGRIGVSGAQPADLLLDAMERAWDGAPEAPDTADTGEICGPDGCVLPLAHPATS